MIKTFSVPPEMHVHTGPARVFDFEDEAVHALVSRKVTPATCSSSGTKVRANGMPEMYYAAAILSADPVLNVTTAIVTDGRYSGAMRGPCIGHVAPEAFDGGPIALVVGGDLIEVNAPERRLAIVGVDGEHPLARGNGGDTRRQEEHQEAPAAAPRQRDPLAVRARCPQRHRGGVHHLTADHRPSRLR
jgi:dihydroxyacid dehydratase/phosphogluconate dehydratase